MVSLTNGPELDSAIGVKVANQRVGASPSGRNSQASAETLAVLPGLQGSGALMALRPFLQPSFLVLFHVVLILFSFEEG